MKEENKAPKKGWQGIFRKKWFFPAVYLTIAAVLLGVVVWYQNLDNQLSKVGDDQNLSDNYTPNPHDPDSEAVMGSQEVIKFPVADPEQAEIVTKFFDYDASEEDRESALILHNNRYYQSTGVDIVYPSGESFDVVAALSGQVMEVKEDPLLGNVVILSHENGVATYYASLGEVGVKQGDEVKQGDVIGKAGDNKFGQNIGTHLHFEIRKDEQVFNPEEYFNQPVTKLDSESEDVSEEQDTSSVNSEDEDSKNKSSDVDKEEATESESDTEKSKEESNNKDNSKDDSKKESKEDSVEDTDSTDSDA
ncbi:M23 family metallopeptidase [Ornithinibacillus bavariensis]|uniref:Stage II sporulation protein Q n=1 Tax=Ornithinibacillus bavariensis TaxID=545502 RepID=A0A919X6L3_9BACI|nr:M23 family metallopeptidase [Ornithinibacillus bavariensis]GIO26882.1 stage II sporulation protein Q [Ornithinibacillus bavariensis]HAM80672.1 stage II sporulation protein [Ornithinibacillus sp.]